MKEFLVYFIIFLITIMIIGGILVYYYYQNVTTRVDSDTLMIQDALTVATLDDIEEEEEEIDNVRRRRQQDIDDEAFDNLAEHERHFLQLMRNLRILHGGEVEEEDVEEEEDRLLALMAHMDSTIVALIAQNDSLRSIIIHQIVDLNALRERNRNLMQDMSILDDIIISLHDMISDLREEIEVVSTPTEIEEETRATEVAEVVHDFRQVARLYNNMGNARVSQLLQRMPPEQSVEILRLMNQRKVAQIMDLLPPDVASVYSVLLMTN